MLTNDVNKALDMKSLVTGKKARLTKKDLRLLFRKP